MRNSARDCPHQYIERGSGTVKTEHFIADPLIAWLYSAARESHPYLFKLATQRHGTRGRMQITLRMTANQLCILDEGHGAFDNARTHARSRGVGFLGVFRKLQRRTAVCNGKISTIERPNFTA